ncbi:sarcosine oxidase subunit delta [Actibacterium sp. 188UL27-1]|uniref:sarcosine oxidase subunit delta n=1 Tax=Actibacterium sp. 188UL27-1 TaxID=2786961 RepID=UPI00195C4416|nr:sarcosine oxidase subunit delta [Actibacterium sp. 188UL27-1]MBM7069210.1 sarcosine oxidase subunit delta [Actibacterium sp. 188UL27-1]
MRINCPLCGLRDLREFSIKGDAVALDRPAEDGDWHSYLHLRDNPSGETRELWFHGQGCGAWLVVHRDTTTHAIKSVTLAAETTP